MSIIVGCKLRNIKISPQKLNLVVTNIRNKHVSEAINILEFSKKRIAKVVLKSVISAISNAENNFNLDIDNLYIKEASVGKGLVMKRFHARARGRGARILKPFSHLNICVEEREGAE